MQKKYSIKICMYSWFLKSYKIKRIITLQPQWINFRKWAAMSTKTINRNTGKDWISNSTKCCEDVEERHYIKSSYFLNVLLPRTISHNSLVFNDFDCFEEYWTVILWNVPWNGIHMRFFSWFNWECVFWGGRPQR